MVISCCCSGDTFSICFPVPSAFTSLFGVDAPVGVDESRLSKAVVETVPSDAMFNRVVVASAGKDLVEFPAFLVNWKEGCRICLGLSRREVVDSAMPDATFCATEMLSRATSVTGAALEVRETVDQEPGYQL